VKTMLRSVLVMPLCVAGLSAWQPADAQSYPAKPIRMIIPYPPGGGVDAIMRPFAQDLSARLGQQIIIDNRGGSGGSIGMEAVARAAPDGHTIVAAITAQLAINPALYRSLWVAKS
jgi:tripartite-type tricarboxylate transporter receptor subunit TctC